MKFKLSEHCLGHWLVYALMAAVDLGITIRTGLDLRHSFSIPLLVVHIDLAIFTLFFAAIAIRNYRHDKRDIL